MTTDKARDDGVQGDPSSKTCRGCFADKVNRNGALVCGKCDGVNLWPVFREPGA